MNKVIEVFCLICGLGCMVYAVYHFKTFKWNSLWVGLLAVLVSIHLLVLSIGVLVLGK